MATELFHTWDGLESADDSGGAVECDSADGPPSLSSPYQRLQTTLRTISVDRGDGNQATATETAVAVGYQLVGRNWGESREAFVGGEMALITLDTSCPLSVVDIPAVAISLEKHGCHILRWKPAALLVAFRTEQQYSTFGRAMGQSGMLPGTKLRALTLQGALYADFPPCFLISQQSSAHEAASVRADLDGAVRPFQSQFRFISVTDNLSVSESLSSAHNPSIGIVLLFSGRQQSIALSCLQNLCSPSSRWQAVDLPHDVVAQLGAETPRIFRHRAVHFPSVGVATGYPLDGVRVVVYVRDGPTDSGKDRFSAMVNFYERLLGRSSSTHTKLSSTVEYQTFSQTSRMSEFVVARYGGLHVQPSASNRLCFLLRNASPDLLAGSQRLTAGFCQLVDPDGNLVLCACPLQ